MRMYIRWEKLALTHLLLTTSNRSTLPRDSCWATNSFHEISLKKSQQWRYWHYNQCFGSGFIDSGTNLLGWISIRIQVDDQKLGKIEKKFAFFFKNPQASIKDSKPSALKREDQVFQNMKFFQFFLFPIFVGHFCPPGARSGSTDLIDRNTDSNPALCTLTDSKWITRTWAWVLFGGVGFNLCETINDLPISHLVHEVEA